MNNDNRTASGDNPGGTWADRLLASMRQPRRGPGRPPGKASSGKTFPWAASAVPRRTSPAARAARAARQRRYRHRVAAGEVVVRLSLPEHAVALALTRSQRLSAEDALNRDRVCEALTEMLVDWAASWAEQAC